MVNYGRSGACVTCKQRKVKCDESRPGCRKCQRIGRSCPGYPNQWDLAYRNENDVVQKKVHWNSKTIQRIPSAKMLMMESTLIDERLQAICLFFQDYTISTCGPCPGWLYFLPKMYQLSAASSLLHHAVCTTAYANLAQKTERPDLAIMAMSHYRESLDIVKRTLLSPRIAVDDCTMTGVMLLGIYECINSTLVEVPQYLHSSGLETLADLRGSLLMQGYGPSLLQIVCCQMQRRTLDHKTAPSPADERLVKLLDPSTLPNRMIINKFEVSKFVANVNAKIRSSQISRQWDGIWQEFQRLENKFLVWDGEASQEFGFVQIQQPSGAGDKTFVYHSYLGFWTLSIWNKHRAARIILHQTLLEAIDASEYSCSGSDPGALDEELYASSKSIIQDMADFIFASIPFSLGDVPLPSTINGPKSVGGYFLVWVLQVILRCPFVTETQRHQARDALLRVGKQCGISYATIFAQQYGASSPALFKPNHHDSVIINNMSPRGIAF
ncbi:uncharacterized protein PAC_13637 [Phialocephala subalpina]|uniref:Zn(2)-C6 fungal-type domain-containing protein n=1 Tax=Phialocephala subalpina TaxID=576137 RepID=A0A1L7XFB7_9HELO|nr:uncharacterized protein PAC_13637 [Phialocephala subalpina]